MNGKIKPLVWLLASTKKELEPITKLKSASIARSFYDQYLWEITDSRRNVYLVATTGIGKANAAFTVGALAEISEKPLFIMNVGIAGTYYSPPVLPGDVVIVTDCIMGDEGVWEKPDCFRSYEAIGIPPLNSDEASLEGKLSLQDSFIFRRLCNLLPPGSHSSEDLLGPDTFQDSGEQLSSYNKTFNIWYGSSCSVGMASGSPSIASLRRQIYGAVIEEMEISAIALASFRMGIPFIALRGISNIAGERDRTKWEIEKAIFNVCACAIKVFKEIG
ncbi:MAG: hypothetical protein ACP5TY_08885 [Thermodesulforhabdaceae bacterium]